jgi:hypothetical protein
MRYKITALKRVESYTEAPDITVAGLQATIECARDHVTLLSVEPAVDPDMTLIPDTFPPGVQRWEPPNLETTTDFELDHI